MSPKIVSSSAATLAAVSAFTTTNSRCQHARGVLRRHRGSLRILDALATGRDCAPPVENLARQIVAALD